MPRDEPQFLPSEIGAAALVLSSCLSLAGMWLGGGIGWCLTVPLIGLAAWLWPRRALLMPLLGLGLSAALYSLARALGAPSTLLPETSLIVLALGYSIILALRPGLRLQVQLEATTARVELEQEVLEVQANLAQLAARSDLSVPEAARLALRLLGSALPQTGALLLSHFPDGRREVEELIGGILPDTPGPAIWEAHRASQASFFNAVAWTALDPGWYGADRRGADWCGAVAILPLRLPGEVSVSLVLGRAGQAARWGLHDRQLLETASRSLRLVAQHQQHLQALEYSAHHDALTGCLNRHAFYQALARRRHSARYTLALADLDGFKVLNDREGHARGDQALRLFAAALEAAFPGSQTVFRLGGDEFALLLDEPADSPADWSAPGTHGEIALQVGVIPAQLAAAGLYLSGVSVGAAHASEASGGEAVLGLADRRMYLHKQQRPAAGRAALGAAPDARTAPADQTGATSSLDRALLLLGVVLEARDVETHDHSLRVVRWAIDLGQRLHLSGAELAALKQGAYLHDLGKLVVPDRVLLKPGPLDAEEWALMQTHVMAGHRLASTLEFLDPQVLEVIRAHHERWDGQGYPDRLVGQQIPLLARIYAVVDVFDALTSRRPYKEPWTADQALAEIRLQSGRQFDPAVVRAFLSLWDQPRPAHQTELLLNA
jgi:diguanylate cyclase (GGDEF)-like protein